MEIMKGRRPREKAGAHLTDMLEKYKDANVLLMLSGGSAISILASVEIRVLGPRLTITTLDERFSRDPKVNNFAQMKTTDFFEKARAAGADMISTEIDESETLNESGGRFEKALFRWRADHPNGVILATMGIGEDGHVAGIFPESEACEVSDDVWVYAYEVADDVNPYTKRITTTFPFLKNEITEALVFAVGSKKRSVISQLKEERCDIQKTPACVLLEMKSVTVVTDE